MPNFTTNVLFYRAIIALLKNMSQINVMLGRSPGLVVMGRDSRSEGRGFKSQHCILDGNFFTYICCKNLFFFCKKFVMFV